MFADNNDGELNMTEVQASTRRTGGIPRGLSRTGPVLFSYGFRPFFLAGALWACAAMAIWIAAITRSLDIGGEYGPHAWHAHEMLFGFAPAILAGFLLTAVPNWTGRLPVSGWPLFLLFLLWCAGRAALLMTDLLGTSVAVAIDSIFLPTLLFICVREVVAGRKWKDLKIVGGLLALSFANVYFHWETIVDGHPDVATRIAVSAYVVLIVIVGGRMIPSFTRNFINRLGRTDFPVPYNAFDTFTIVLAAMALALWSLYPESSVTAVLALLSAVAHVIRLLRWRGWTVLAEPLLSVLHASYAFVPLGLVSIALSALDIMDATSGLHVLTVGTIASMMLAVMTRATRGHTGRELAASRMTSATYVAIIVCALVRPLAGQFPELAPILYPAAGLLWMTAFGGYVWEHGPMLINERRKVRA
jgi:uncharacterized protein involved in response to NO